MVTFEEPPAQMGTYSSDERLCWMGKGSGKGSKGPGPKESKGRFVANCYHCGVAGHRISECRKKDAEMKGTCKCGQQIPGW